MSTSAELGSGLPVAMDQTCSAANASGPARPEAAQATTRSRIIETAERLIRQYGSQKTTVSDLAKALSMSPANIYRFFHSKDDINEAVCRRALDNQRSVATETAHRDATAAQRLRAILVALARFNIERHRTDNALHQLLAMATSESWPVVAEHAERIESILAASVADGMTRGEFHDGDARRAARCIHAAMTCYLHPALTTECSTFNQPTLNDMVDFCLACLRREPPRRNPKGA
jgi:AcrR family transcriptional regulator